MAETNGQRGKEKAQEVTAQARSKLREQVDQRSTQAGRQAKGAAGDVRTVAQELRKQGKDAPARFAEQAAERVERAGGWLEESDGDRILRDVEDFGRSNPWVVVAGGLALGFVASRLLKASSRDRYRSTIAEGPAPSQPDPVGYGSSAAGTASPEVPAAPPREPATTGGI